MSHSFDFMTPKGWQCPVCKNVYSPAMMECITCHKNPQIALNAIKRTDVQKTCEVCEGKGKYQPQEMRSSDDGTSTLTIGEPEKCYNCRGKGYL